MATSLFTDTFEITNLLTWSKTGANATNWATTGVTDADETTIVKVSTNSVKASNDATYGLIGQDVACVSGTDYAQGMWAYVPSANVDDKVTIGLVDDDSQTSYTDNVEGVIGGDVWAWVPETLTTGGSATVIRPKIYPYRWWSTATGELVYFDGPILLAETDLVPTNWTVSGTGAVAHYDYASSGGDFSVALHRVGNDCYLCRSGAWDVAYQGGKATLTANLDATVADRVRLTVYDGVGSTSSAFHTGAGGYTSISVEHTLNGAATEISARLEVVTGDTVGYFDDVELDIELAGAAGTSVALKMLQSGLL